MIWLSPEQLKEIGVTTAMLRHNRSKWVFRPSGINGRNGKPIREVLLESMPAKLQMKYLRRESSEFQVPSSEFAEDRCLTIENKNPVAIAPGSDMCGEPEPERKLVEALTRYGPTVRDAMMAEAMRLAGIVERYSAVFPKRQNSAVGGGSGSGSSGGSRQRESELPTATAKCQLDFVPEVYRLCAEAVCTDPVVLAVERKRGKVPSPHTLEAWARDYKAVGLAAFLRKPPTASGSIDKRKADISAAAIEWINRNWRTKASPTALFRALKKEALKHGWQIPARGWVWRKYQELPKMVASLTFEGEKKFASKWGTYVPRTVEDITALQILCGDHSVRDVTVMLPDGQLTRPWLTTWLCLRSDLFWGWHLDLTPSSNTIGLAYVNGVQTFGAQPLSRPDDDFYSYLYSDQGKDYRCKTLTGQTLEFKNAARIEGGLNVLCTQRKVGFMHEMGLKHIMARGYNAKEKAVERVHADISRWEQNTFTDEYCGRGTEHKPDAWVKAWHKHQRLLKKFDGNLDWLRSESPFMTLDDYREALATGFILEHNQTGHTRSVLGGAKVVPIEEYERLYTTRYEISDDALALLLMRAAKRKIGKNGVTMFASNFQFMDPAMTPFKGEEIEVRYSEGDYSRIWAVLPNGQVIEAENLTRSSILNPNKKTMEAVAKQRAHERKVVRDFRFIQESNYRGETTEDRVAQEINPVEDPQPEERKVAVNAGPQIHALTRFDRPRLVGSSRPTVTAEDVEKAEVIQGMFGDERPKTRIKKEWED